MGSSFIATKVPCVIFPGNSRMAALSMGVAILAGGNCPWLRPSLSDLAYFAVGFYHHFPPMADRLPYSHHRLPRLPDRHFYPNLYRLSYGYFKGAAGWWKTFRIGLAAFRF
jgi:hypothetical protein